jgi:hypothetical protein
MQPRSPSALYFYLMVAFSVAVLGYSIWMLYTGLVAMKEGNTETFYYTAFISLIGIMLALSSLAQIRRRVSILPKLGARVLTVVLCDKCNFKMVRNFTPGDYVFKEAGKCQQCNEPMYISQIYQEAPKKKEY